MDRCINFACDPEREQLLTEEWFPFFFFLFSFLFLQCLRQHLKGDALKARYTQEQQVPNVAERRLCSHQRWGVWSRESIANKS